MAGPATQPNRILPMPVPKLKKALKFKVKCLEDLKLFLEEFEAAAMHCKLTEKEKSKEVVKYADKESKEFWKGLEGYDDDFMVLKDKILSLYSKEHVDNMLMVQKLKKYVKKTFCYCMYKEEELDTYYTKFHTWSKCLITAMKLSDCQQ
jgi:hypothetical protein